VTTIIRWLFAGPGSARMLQLDLLRGVAILLVLFTHAVVPPTASGSWQRVLGYLHHLGPSGVDLFFVLSGFLVGGLLFKELRATGGLDVRRFLVRRAFKIWPSYFAFVGAMLLWLLMANRLPLAASVGAVLPNLLHVQNYFGSPREHTWSLAVEEHFYLVLPLLLVLATRLGPTSKAVRAVPWLALVLCVVCALLRLHAYAVEMPFNPHYATHLRVDSLFFGVLLAYFYHFAPHRLTFASTYRRALLCVGVTLLLLYPLLAMTDHGNLIVGSLGFVVLYLGYGCCLLVAIHTPIGVGRLGRQLAGVPARTAAFIGYYSYPIYLWHIDATRPVGHVFALSWTADWWPELRWLVAFIVYVVFAVAAGMVFGILLEKPSLAVRDRLFPARSGRISRPESPPTA